MPIVSVIVPVFNVEKYLDKCIESLIKQKLKDIEIILVDDGSTDLSGKICDEWKTRDSRIQVIHKKNGGLSDARNVGVELAKGKYIGFVDSDDYVSDDMFQILYQNIEKENADISICGMYHCYADKIITKANEGYMVINEIEAMQMCLNSKKISVCVVNRLYSAQIAKEVKFPYGKCSEDVFVLVDYFSHAKKVVVDLRPQYYYVHREGTISTAPYRKNDLDVIEGYENNLRIIREQYPQLEEAALFRCYWARFYVLDKIYQAVNFTDKEVKKEIKEYLRKNCLRILKNRYVGKARKVALIGLLINENIYKFCLKKQRERCKRN